MAKQSEVDELQELVNELEAQAQYKDAALSEARKGLFRIQGADPARYVRGPAGSGQKLPIAKCLDDVRSVAQRTLIAMSDMEYVRG